MVFTEYVVPTCSYRMGTDKIGAAVAVIGKSAAKIIESFSEPIDDDGNENVKGLMSKTIAVHVHYKSWYICLPSSTKNREF